MKNVKLSVITICYNARDEIERTLLSVINQSFKDFEYIIIDGGSTDGTMDIVRKYSDKINIIVSESDKGIYDAMNKGIKLAHGTWLNMMNAGDKFASDHVLSDVFKDEIKENISFLYSDNYIDCKSSKMKLSYNNHEIMRVNHQSSIYRKSLHQEHGYYAVTKKIIVSDLLFFLQVPRDAYKKVDCVISINQPGGVSSGKWCLQQALCAKVVFRDYSFYEMLLHYVSARIKAILHII